MFATGGFKSGMKHLVSGDAQPHLDNSVTQQKMGFQIDQNAETGGRH